MEPLDRVRSVGIGEHREQRRDLIDEGQPEQLSQRGTVGASTEQDSWDEGGRQSDVRPRHVHSAQGHPGAHEQGKDSQERDHSSVSEGEPEGEDAQRDEARDHRAGGHQSADDKTEPDHGHAERRQARCLQQPPRPHRSHAASTGAAFTGTPLRRCLTSTRIGPWAYSRPRAAASRARADGSSTDRARAPPTREIRASCHPQAP